jgi:chloramphenicol 3-O phosphotransferase
MASQGLNLIVDDVLMGSEDPGNAEYQDLLSPFGYFKVGYSPA